MNRVVLENTRDVPLTTDLLAFMQASYSALEKLAAIGGDNFIVSGCTVSGTTATSGWMVLKGKLVPFTGGSIQTNVRIITTENVYPVGAGSETEIVYIAEFGTSASPEDNVAWSSIKRPNTTIYLSEQISTLLSSTIPGLGQEITGIRDRLDVLESSDGWHQATLKEGSAVLTTELLALRRIGNVVHYYARFRFNTDSPILYPVWDLPDWAIPANPLFSDGRFHLDKFLSESQIAGEVNYLPATFYADNNANFPKELRVIRGYAAGSALPHTHTGNNFEMSGTYLV